MKKLYCCTLLFLISFLTIHSQIIITELADPDNNASARYVELYNISGGDVDLTGWELRRYTNDNIDPQPSGIDLSSIGTLASGDYVLIAANSTEFASVYGFTPDIDAGTAGAADSNGDDQIAVYDENDTIIDIFGVPGEDGSGTCHEFEDGRAERKATVTASNSTFDESEWNVWADSEVMGCTSHTLQAQIAPDDFDAGSWLGDPNACNVTFGSPVYNCTTTTPGNNNDGLTVDVAYTGSDNTITSLTLSNGILGGDNPATTANGTITISNLNEGDTVNLTINGGDCDGQVIFSDVPSDACDPAPNTCFDLSTGTEQFETVVVAANVDNDEWTFDSGVYSMNGFCGSGCDDTIDTWLIFGPLDMTGVNDLMLSFGAAENFSQTDLLIRYTSSYSGCPGTSSWTTAGTIVDSGVYSIDLSAATGTDVFIGVQYSDDGLDGYSSWDLTNVKLEAQGNCPSLGSRPTSSCDVCDVAFGDASYTCATNTAGIDNDGVTITIPYTGSEASITSVTTTSSGTVGGDNPSVTADGQITLSGLMEGDTWDIVLNGGPCDGTSISGSVPSTFCDPVNCTAVGDIIITEIMQNPSQNADPAGEYFELYNSTASPVDLINWIIKDDVTESEMHLISTNVVIPAGDYIVIGNGATPNGGLTLDYSYDNDISLGNGTDGIVLECGGNIIDQVIWDNGATFPDPTGASMELAIDALSATDNDLGSNWGVATSAFGDGDLGTPGAVNDYTLSIENFTTDTFKLYPNPNSTGVLYIRSTLTDNISVSVFDILGKEVIRQNLIDEKLDVSELQSGVYIIKLTQEKASIAKKLIIK